MGERGQASVEFILVVTLVALGGIFSFAYFSGAISQVVQQTGNQLRYEDRKAPPAGKGDAPLAADAARKAGRLPEAGEAGGSRLVEPPRTADYRGTPFRNLRKAPAPSQPVYAKMARTIVPYRDWILWVVGILMVGVLGYILADRVQIMIRQAR